MTVGSRCASSSCASFSSGSASDAVTTRGPEAAAAPSASASASSASSCTKATPSGGSAGSPAAASNAASFTAMKGSGLWRRLQPAARLAKAAGPPTSPPAGTCKFAITAASPTPAWSIQSSASATPVRAISDALCSKTRVLSSSAVAATSNGRAAAATAARSCSAVRVFGTPASQPWRAPRTTLNAGYDVTPYASLAGLYCVQSRRPNSMPSTPVEASVSKASRTSLHCLHHGA